jgi:Cu-Zn family superoxide dismutase
MRLTLAVLCFAAAFVPARAEDAPQADPMVTGFADLANNTGEAAGNAILKPGPKGVLVRVEASGLTPGWHGMHLHEKGDCSDNAAGFKASGAHVGHGDAVKHGLLNPEGPEFGDVPNLFAAGDGTAKGEFYLAGSTLETLLDADGTAIIIHAAEDDHTAQPIGNAGARVACGVVMKAQ